MSRGPEAFVGKASKFCGSDRDRDIDQKQNSRKLGEKAND
jgi:hypothetical protein